MLAGVPGAVGTIATTGGPATVAGVGASSGLSKDVFLQLLLAELRYQNPLAPVDSKDFLGQMAQLSLLEQVQSAAQVLGEFRQDFLKIAEVEKAAWQAQSLAAGAALIGRIAHGTADDGQEIQGEVRQAMLKQGQTYLVLDGSRLLNLVNVLSVMPAAPAAGAGGNSADQT